MAVHSRKFCKRRFSLSSVHLEYSSPRHLSFRLAETKEDYESVFRILHDSYVEYGFCSPSENGLRVTPYHALPSTKTVVIEWKNQIIGSLSVIPDNEFGLPIEHLYSVSDFRNNGWAIGELSGLSIQREFRNCSSDILMPLFKYMREFTQNYLGIDVLFIAINPRKRYFFDWVLHFQPLSRKVSSYKFVNGAPAVGRFLNLREYSKVLYRQYAHLPDEKNLHKYFYEWELKNASFPSTDTLQSKGIMSPETMDYFFRKKTSVFQTLPSLALVKISSLYHSASYKKIILSSAVSHSTVIEKKSNFLDGLYSN